MAANPVSLDELARSHWTPVFRFLLHLSGDVHTAEELTQEAFLRAMQNLGQLQPATHPRAWLMQIARNLFLDRVRRQKTVTFEPLSPTTDPAVRSMPAIDVQDDAAKVRAGLALLPETTRSVFLMRVEGELPFSEIAAALAISSDAARWHMGRARQQLLHHLTDEPRKES